MIKGKNCGPGDDRAGPYRDNICLAQGWALGVVKAVCRQTVLQRGTLHKEIRLLTRTEYVLLESRRKAERKVIQCV